jgi:hypothetical protein
MVAEVNHFWFKYVKGLEMVSLNYVHKFFQKETELNAYDILTKKNAAHLNYVYE